MGIVEFGLHTHNTQLYNLLQNNQFEDEEETFIDSMFDCYVRPFHKSYIAGSQLCQNPTSTICVRGGKLYILFFSFCKSGQKGKGGGRLFLTEAGSIFHNLVNFYSLVSAKDSHNTTSLVTESHIRDVIQWKSN
jgi:hypothetical protein